MGNDRFDKFTERARRVLTLAQEEARSFNHNYIGTEHLLLGLVREGEGIASAVLEKLGVRLEKVRTQTVNVLGQSNVLSQSQPAEGAAGQEPRGPSEGRRQLHLEYLVAQVEYPQWDELGVDGERRQRDGAGVVKRFLGPDEAHADLHGKPVHDALSVLGVEGWELVAIDNPAPAGGPSGHYYVFKRLAFEEGSPR